MSDRPIPFSAPMVRALLDGRKTQTRRVLPVRHPRCPHHHHIRMDVLTFDPQEPAVWYWDGVHDRVGASYRLPYAPGDRLWVREAWSGFYALRNVKPSERERGIFPDVWWWADGDPLRGDWERPRPSIHMPRWASRLTLHVTEVRVQRLQEISAADALEEGVQGAGEYLDMPRMAFRSLWNSLHGPAAWDANPWVCAISFTVERANIDQARLTEEAQG